VVRDQALIDRFGRNLRRARLERGWSQAQLARESGLDVTEISRIERGSREVRLTTLMRLLVDALGAPPHELLSGLTLPVRTTHSDESPQQAADAL
jgi:transcriptional regulator with XRE-family HTH domain